MMLNPRSEKETETIAKSNEDLIKDIKETLGDKVAEVKISSRLKSSAVCLVADEQGQALLWNKLLLMQIIQCSKLDVF